MVKKTHTRLLYDPGGGNWVAGGLVQRYSMMSPCLLSS